MRFSLDALDINSFVNIIFCDNFLTVVQSCFKLQLQS